MIPLVKIYASGDGEYYLYYAFYITLPSTYFMLKSCCNYSVTALEGSHRGLVRGSGKAVGE